MLKKSHVFTIDVWEVNHETGSKKLKASDDVRGGNRASRAYAKMLESWGAGHYFEVVDKTTGRRIHPAALRTDGIDWDTAETFDIVE